MDPVLRIIDANANRAREALRVLEEAARFILDDAPLTATAKGLRHDLVAALAPLGDLVAGRDTPGDVGTRLSTGSERGRGAARDVVAAAGARLGEALRVIEEYGKTIDPDVAAAVERIRYDAYDLEQRLRRALGAGRPVAWRLCLLLSEGLCPGGRWEPVLAAALDAGADCVQVREKRLPDDALLARARRVVDLARGRAAVVVNDRPDVALLAGADGVHVGRDDLPVPEVRRLAGDRLLVGVSTSCLDEAEQALRGGADVCGVGPMFPSTTKHKPDIAGPAYLRAYLAWGRLPHLAIGGITPDNVGELVEAGVGGIAVSGAVCGADDPGAVVRALRAALDRRPAPRPSAAGTA
ncbi:MAG: thiamine phosphate synthase [Planctomycetota bacterium]|jgi:thiamine-phosphate pyrophosphorylase